MLSALGIGFDLHPEDVAARGNFCTIDENGLITDRRAGRIPTEIGEKLVALLRDIQLPGIQAFAEPVKEYRLVVVLRPTAGQTLHGNIHDTDPQKTGVPSLPARAEDQASEATAELFNDWIAAAREILKDHHPANSLNLRGFAKDPGLPKFPDIFGLKAGAIATYPMYRGVAKLVGMDVLPVGGETVEDEVDTLRAHWDEYDYFFFHVKKTDSAGEDGDFDLKAQVIEHVDEAVVPAILDLDPDVLIVTGDHSTPSGPQEPFLAPGAHLALESLLPAGRHRGVRRAGLRARQPWGLSRHGRIAPGSGPRPQTEQVRGLTSTRPPAK